MAPVYPPCSMPLVVVGGSRLFPLCPLTSGHIELVAPNNLWPWGPKIVKQAKGREPLAMTWRNAASWSGDGSLSAPGKSPYFCLHVSYRAACSAGSIGTTSASKVGSSIALRLRRLVVAVPGSLHLRPAVLEDQVPQDRLGCARILSAHTRRRDSSLACSTGSNGLTLAGPGAFGSWSSGTLRSALNWPHI